MDTTVIDKRGVLPTLTPERPVTLELGCGPRKASPEAIGIDALDTDAVDLVGDALAALKLFPDGSVARIGSAHFLEHVDDLEALLTECARVLADNGALEAVVPHFSNPYFYSDPTHRRTFGLYTFSYLAESALFAREVPRYGRDYGFLLLSVDLVFKSPFPVRNALKRAWGWWVNRAAFTREFYEENLCHAVPCYEVRYVLRRKPRTRVP